ncbi:MAG: selenocysteine-specific translation elongation factor [Planctomycetota bacterium]|nr:selenocysteine-specific translation elongation factor [Planctomycetota bacterium]
MAKTAQPLTESDIFNIVIGTAGHIDHGKSALVRHLTGIDPDRLKEEQERGMTIDLGFAPLMLGDGRRVGIVDVPGHERFIKNMVAGVTGIDAVILVVAADDGVMPQTREHMDIMGLLGVTRGVVAITKSDIVDEELRELVIDDVRRYLEGTFLESSPVICTSTVTGGGFEEFQEALQLMLDDVPHRSVDGIFRMPIQRVFSAKGHGTVVTGIPISGRARVGDLLEIQPGEMGGRVRGIQAYHLPSESARAGHSSALNLSDVNYREVQRGQVVVAPDTFRPGSLIEARLQCLTSIRRPLKHLSLVRFHVGTAEEIGRVAILDKGSLAAGESGYVQIRLDNPIVVAPGDRFVIRLHSPMITIGGGEILGSSRWRLKSGKEYVLERLREKEKSVGEASMTLANLVKDAGSHGIARDELKRSSLLQAAEFASVSKAMMDDGEILELSKPVRYIHREGIERIQERILSVLREFHEEEPLRLGMPRGHLEKKTGVERQPVEMALAKLIESDRVATEGREGIRIKEYAVRLAPEQQKIVEKILEIYRETGFATPRPEGLSEKVGEPVEELLPLLRYLVESEDLVDLGGGVILASESIKEASRIALETIQLEGELTVVRFKGLLETTRKYIVPLLEHLDDLGVTVRDGNRRFAAAGINTPATRKEGGSGL